MTDKAAKQCLADTLFQHSKNAPESAKQRVSAAKTAFATKFSAMIEEIKKLRNWEPCQLSYFDAFIHGRDVILICTGPGGTGKSLASAMVAVALAKCGISVMMTSSTDTAANAWFQKVLEASKALGLEQTAEKPGAIRLHSRHVETNSICYKRGRFSRHDHEFSGEVLSGEYDMDIVANDKLAPLPSSAKNRSALPRHGAGSAFLDFYKDRSFKTTAVIRKHDITVGAVFDGEGTQIKFERTAGFGRWLDVAKYLRSHHEQMQKKGRLAKNFDREQTEMYGEKALTEFVGKAKIIVTTVGVSALSPHLKAFCKHSPGFVYMMDDATEVVESHMVNSLMGTVPEERFEDYGNRFPCGRLVLLGDVFQTQPQIPSRAYNEFAAQMALGTMKRLIIAGQPCIRFDVQLRVHEQIWKTIIAPVVYPKQSIECGRAARSTDASRRFTTKQIEILSKVLDAKDVKEYINDSGAPIWETEKNLHCCLLEPAEKPTSPAKIPTQEAPAAASIQIPTVRIWEKLLLLLFEDHYQNIDPKKRAFAMKDWMYVTPYISQFMQAQDTLLRLVENFNTYVAEKRKLVAKDLPRMRVAHLASSEEAECVFYDLASAGELVTLENDGRVNTHLTRSRNLLWIVADPGILEQLEADRNTTGVTQPVSPAVKALKRLREVDGARFKPACDTKLTDFGVSSSSFASLQLLISDRTSSSPCRSTCSMETVTSTQHTLSAL